IGVKEVATLNQFATENLTPDLTLYLDVDAQVGLNRIGSEFSNRQKDRLELEKIDFHNRVREAYQVLSANNSERMVLIDATQSKEEVLVDAWQVLESKLQELDLLK